MIVRPLAALLLLLPLVSVAVEDFTVEPVEPRAVERDVTHRWGVGLAYGEQHYGTDGEAGESGALQLTYRAYVDTPREGRWLFELGFERALSYTDPEIDAAGTQRRLQSTGLFYRFSRFIGTRFYVGGRVGFARVRGTEEKGNLDLVLGLQTGVRITDWLDAGVELVSSDTSFSDRAGYPADLRGVITLSF